MKKFEEEFDKFHRENHNMHKTATEYHKALKRHFKDVMFPEDYQSDIEQLKSQIEKQHPEIPEVPQEVAEIYEKHAAQHHRLSETLLELYSCRLLDMTQGEIDDLVISMKLYGYSVKGKRFYLKSDRELESRGDTCIGYVTLYLNNDGYFTTNRKRARKFTQSEIDSMGIGSCEKVEVKE